MPEGFVPKCSGTKQRVSLVLPPPASDGVTSRRREEEEVFSLSRRGQFSSAVRGPPGVFLAGGPLDSGSQTSRWLRLSLFHVVFRPP
ncbi:hypothetical protein EYF80_004938 [Liparis tanakae]|uniref:Uncharacterized protein n=1 Tax=Liparis tanakae TaxID=230148 RepID=A0A4Z2J5T5_9TELE|nr:hypothetical protein EYF80_004938 [Liparis tanakae]